MRKWRHRWICYVIFFFFFAKRRRVFFFSFFFVYFKLNHHIRFTSILKQLVFYSHDCVYEDKGGISIILNECLQDKDKRPCWMLLQKCFFFVRFFSPIFVSFHLGLRVCFICFIVLLYFFFVRSFAVVTLLPFWTTVAAQGMHIFAFDPLLCAFIFFSS